MLRFASILVLLSLSLTACGGDDDGGSSGASLAEMSDDEIDAMCGSIHELYAAEDYQTVSCYLDGINAAQEGGSCEDEAVACLDEEVTDDGALDCETLTLDPLPACAADVTAAEVEECFASVAADMESKADEISCDSDPEDYFGSATDACFALYQACPDLMGG